MTSASTRRSGNYQSTSSSREDFQKASKILDEVEEQLGPVTEATEHLRTLVGITTALLTIATVATVMVGMEMWREARDEKMEERRSWMGSVSSLDSSIVDEDNGGEVEYDDVTNRRLHGCHGNETKEIAVR